MDRGVRRRLREVGWALVAIGGGVIAGSLFAGEVADASHVHAQLELRDRWTSERTRPGPPTRIDEDPVVRPARDGPARDREPDAIGGLTGARDRVGSPREPADGDPFGLLWFEREDERVVTEDHLVVLAGVTDRVLARAPGRYPRSAPPGGPGNLAIAGHRTTHGAPFDGLDELQAGDTIHVVDTDGVEWAYRYRESRIVHPADVWVVGSDPLGTGEAMLTLTTCHPRHSARQRLVVFAVLDGRVHRPSSDRRPGAAPGTIR